MTLSAHTTFWVDYNQKKKLSCILKVFFVFSDKKKNFIIIPFIITDCDSIFQKWPNFHDQKCLKKSPNLDTNVFLQSFGLTIIQKKVYILCNKTFCSREIKNFFFHDHIYNNTFKLHFTFFFGHISMISGYCGKFRFFFFLLFSSYNLVGLSLSQNILDCVLDMFLLLEQKKKILLSSLLW